LLDFYKFLLHYNFNFDDINNFNIYINAFIEGVSKHLENLQKEFPIIKDYKTNVNILECFADVFAIFYMPFKMPEKMRSLGIWQKYIFKYFSEKFKNKDEIIERNKIKNENKTIDDVENEDNVEYKDKDKN